MVIQTEPNTAPPGQTFSPAHSRCSSDSRSSAAFSSSHSHSASSSSSCSFPAPSLLFPCQYSSLLFSCLLFPPFSFPSFLPFLVSGLFTPIRVLHHFHCIIHPQSPLHLMLKQPVGMLAVRLYHPHVVFAMGDGFVHRWLNQSVSVSDKEERDDAQSPPNSFAPMSPTCVRLRSRSPRRAPFVDNNLTIKQALQRGFPVGFHCCDHDGIWQIFERGDVLLFEPVVDIYIYISL